MKVRRGKSGVRTEVMRRVRGLEARCEALEEKVCALTLAETVAEANRRISMLEELADRCRRKTG